MKRSLVASEQRHTISNEVGVIDLVELAGIKKYSAWIEISSSSGTSSVDSPEINTATKGATLNSFLYAKSIVCVVFKSSIERVLEPQTNLYSF